MLRGGSWNNSAENCRSTNRNRNPPDNRNNNVGFRLVRLPAHHAGGRRPADPDEIPSPALPGQKLKYPAGAGSRCGCLATAPAGLIFTGEKDETITDKNGQGDSKPV